MDFKIAGTTKGITAIQVDTKLKGIPMNIIQETITQALTGRLEIMDVMMETIATPRAAISQYAPKIFVFTINPDKVRLVIGK
jgi:polyribonucleotide nucleotidyltransferase